MKLEKYIKENYLNKGKSLWRFCEDFGKSVNSLKSYLKTNEYEVLERGGKVVLVKVVAEVDL